MFDTQKFETFSMTTEAERLKLYEISKNIDLEENDCLLEFGVYFGGSLEALAMGLSENKSNLNNKVYGIDFFQTNISGDFAKIVQTDAQTLGLEHLLKIQNDKLDWLDIVKSKLNSHHNVQLIQTKSQSYTHKYGKIALIHFDLPKFYNELYEIFKISLDDIKEDCIFIFQDFFYHWSAELIAFVFYLIKNKIVEFVYGVSSSLICKNLSLSLEDLDAFKNLLQEPMQILHLLDECHLFLREKNFCGARVIFAEEYYMAVIQYATLHNNETIKNKYENIFSSIMTSYGKKMYAELEAYNFNFRATYNQDLDL